MESIYMRNAEYRSSRSPSLVRYGFFPLPLFSSARILSTKYNSHMIEESQILPPSTAYCPVRFSFPCLLMNMHLMI